MDISISVQLPIPGDTWSGYSNISNLQFLILFFWKMSYICEICARSPWPLIIISNIYTPQKDW